MVSVDVKLHVKGFGKGFRKRKKAVLKQVWPLIRASAKLEFASSVPLSLYGAQ